MDRIPQIKRTRNTMILIPDEVLLSNVFIRLAAKQIAQMRSLSKTWNSLLSHPSFIQSHLDYYSKHDILMVFENGYLKSRSFTELTITSPTGDVRLTNSVNSNSRPQGDVVGSVRGLICLVGDRDVKIWNPSLSALIVLPFPPSTIRNGYDSCHGDFRFGFDPKANDYKVVLFTFYFNLADDRTFNCASVKVFSLRKGSWVSVTERFPSNVRRVGFKSWMLNRNHVFVDGYDGRLHYLSANGNNDVGTIVAFDLGDETFSEIALPADCVSRVNEIGVLSQKLCVMSCVANGGCEVWVMENYGWAKRHVIPKYDAEDIVPLGFTLNNQFLFRHGIHLSLYDTEASTYSCLKGATVKCYKKENVVPYYDTVKVVQYVDSLVWVTPSIMMSASQVEKKQHLLDG